MQYNETEDDLPLHPRGNRDEGHVREIEDHSPDREVTLNTGVVLGIFFALALLCAVFFGFGYSIGHKSAPQAMAAAPEPDVTTTTVDPGTSTISKPSATVPKPVPGYVPSTNAKAAATTPKPSATAVSVEPATAGGVTSTKPATVPHPVAEAHAAKVATPVPTPATAPVSAPATTGTIYVQVAAVSHQEDADVLTNALRRRGYAVHPRSDAGDQLIHVQVGPFSTRKEADAMRQRLAGDGYNGFIK